VLDVAPDFSSGRRCDKNCAEIVPAIIGSANSRGSVTSQEFCVGCPVTAPHLEAGEQLNPAGPSQATDYAPARL
jgi:hypothetical protein